jgi:hypothetical protein
VSSTYNVTSSATTALSETRTVAISTGASPTGTTYIRFWISSVPYKLLGWFIDVGSSTITLPIELASFDAHLKNDQVKIDWSTSSEINNKEFAIERSRDGVNFETLQTHKGAGNSNVSIKYSTIDERPFVGMNYYRLRQTDYNGRTTVSKIVSVNYERTDVWINNVRPNPASNEVGFSLYSPSRAVANIQIIDITGRVILSKQEAVLEGSQDFVTAINDLESGAYYLKVSIDEMGYNYTTKIIKN